MFRAGEELQAERAAKADAEQAASQAAAQATELQSQVEQLQSQLSSLQVSPLQTRGTALHGNWHPSRLLLLHARDEKN